ncbi:MAG TPA: DUF465 domain-containing protein [Allosphingosinicella sp.]|nr:DUF465 domain-containing protein [Allosphingosinicella sp.]
MASQDSEAQSQGAHDPASRLAALRTEHRDLDSAIDALNNMSTSDDVQLARLKKRKLRLKDEIKILEDMTVPNIIA